MTRRDGATTDAEDGVQQRLYRISETIQRELGDTFWAAYSLGDNLQRELVDLAFDLGELSAIRVFERLSRWSAHLQESALIDSGGENLALLIKQARNNFDVYELVKAARERLGVPAGERLDLVRLVQVAYKRGLFGAVWLIEGLGHDYAQQQLDTDCTHEPILRSGPVVNVPVGSLPMLHAGLGLALAEGVLPRLSPWSTRAEFQTTVGEFVERCVHHGQCGYRGAAYESLGLVARTWHPQLVTGIDAVLSAIDPTVRGFFWHGAGRALYFLPQFIVPGVLSPWRAADDLAIDERARQNLQAGLAWATTLVNMRQPEIIAQWLRVRGERLWRSRGFLNGLASAVVVRAETVPDDPFVPALAAYVPREQDRIREIWEAVIAPLIAKALTWYRPVLARHRRLDLLFQSCDLDVAVEAIERGDAPPAPSS